MCGLCGIADFSGRALDRQVIERMTATLAHRGPDDRGLYTSANVALGHTRLSIIDLSAAGHQPMRSQDGTCVMVLNGEVYNFASMRAELEAKGRCFVGHSDTEVALNGYLEWGTEVFRRLNGMFAIALWDARSQELHLVRDRFGIKPLFYREHGGRLAFASEIKALLELDGERKVDWHALAEYLHFGTTLGEKTMFRGIARVSPGCHVRFGRGGSAAAPFASIFDIEPSRDDFATSTRRVRELLEQSVRRHLVADVPVGVFLSGGIDSSAIAALASRHYPGRLRTISAGFDFGGAADERPRARRLAAALGTEHEELYIQGKDLPPVIEALVRQHDVPFGDAANVPLYLMSEALGRNPKVILQGDGGDELFAGYGRYSRLSHRRAFQLAADLAMPFRGLVPEGTNLYRRLGSLDAYRSRHRHSRMARIMSQEDPADPPETVLSEQALDEAQRHDPFERYVRFEEEFCELDPVQRMLYTDCAVILPDVYFEKVDRATMAFGIEARVPMLDNELTRYAMSLPSQYKVKGYKTKHILRKALEDVLPHEILYGRKLGFNVPFQHWLRTSLAPYLRSVLLDADFFATGIFRRADIERRIAQHASGARDHGYLLWKLLNFALWQRRYLLGRSS